jgi:hypothetical protein
LPSCSSCCPLGLCKAMTCTFGCLRIMPGVIDEELLDAGARESYGWHVMLAVALASAILLIVAWLAWTARLVHTGNLDAQALAEKTASPVPASALDWPELHVHAVVAQPDEQSLVLLHVGWPAHTQRDATLVVALDEGDRRSLSLLSRWCAGEASVSPVRRDGGELELRRRQSLERVHAVLIAEDTPAGRDRRTGRPLPPRT